MSKLQMRLCHTNGFTLYNTGNDAVVGEQAVKFLMCDFFETNVILRTSRYYFSGLVRRREGLGGGVERNNAWT